MGKVLVFGVFDRLHDGHRFMLKEAAKYGQVFAAVAREESVLRLKGHLPSEPLTARMAQIKKEGLAEPVAGDLEEGSYDIVRAVHPDCIALGYDQEALAADIAEHMDRGLLSRIRLVHLPPFRPEELHSSLLDIGL